IADQYAVPHRPAVIANIWKVAPDRAVRDQPPAGEWRAEHALEVGDRFLLAHADEAGALPRVRVALGDERAHVGRVPVMMSVEGAVLISHESLRQHLVAPARTVPGELARAMRDARAEVGGASHVGIGAVGVDDEVIGPDL